MPAFLAFPMCKIVNADHRHAAQLAELHGKAFSTGWSDSDFSTHLDNEFDDIWVKKENGKVIGFIVARTQTDQSEVLTIVVDQEYQGNGIGTQLLRTAETKSAQKGSSIMFLDVAADNIPAHALYRRAGYTRYGTRKGYYRRAKGRMDAHLYQKRL